MNTYTVLCLLSRCVDYRKDKHANNYHVRSTVISTTFKKLIIMRILGR